MRHRTTITALAAVILVLTGCTSSNDDADAEPSSSASKLSTDWMTKLENATKADKAICNEVGDEACAEHLTDIALVVTDVELAIDEAGGLDAYPRSMKQIDQINEAVDAYTEHECLGDENAGISGSPCPDDARTIMTGGAALQLALETDESKAG
ncbi:hypothetical protein [Streptomyces albicerus]|uniref:hypothetical protein n=1 Tax=Streptomyces albicerus TaxID=2569859 RepID=UPI00124B29BB|nr:hypothetical protein [Streptomyces albicerus]